MIIIFNILENLIKRCFLYIFLLIFIVGFLLCFAFLNKSEVSFSKIKSAISNTGLFTATITPNPLPSENSTPSSTPGVEEKGLGEIVSEPAASEEGEPRPEDSGRESEQKLTFTGIQETLDDIAEEIDVISQKTAELVGENQEVQGEEKEKQEEPIEEEPEEEEKEEKEKEEEEEKLEKEELEEEEEEEGISLSLVKVLINEIQTASLITAKDEFIELYNPNNQDVDISSWSIQRATQSGTVYKKNFGEENIIGAKDYFLIVNNKANQDLLNLADMAHSSFDLTNNNTIFLVKNQEKIEGGEDKNIVDRVGYGEAYLPEGNPAPNPEKSQSIERKNNQDTDNNFHDFILQSNPTPKGQIITYPKRRRGGGGGSSPPPGKPEELSYCQKLPNSQPNKDKVIINEIAWMGTDNSANDEWIELKNLTDSSISLLDWQIFDQKKQIKIIFPSNNIIPAKGFYLLERTDDDSVPDITADFIYTGALNDSDEALYLFDNNCQFQDEAVANSVWPAGDKGERRSMERNSDLNWQTYYGEGENGIMGTPKAENSSLPLPQPILEVFPGIMEFNIMEFDTTSQSKIFTISNSGEGILEWESIIEYDSSSFNGTEWLGIEPKFGIVSVDSPSDVLVFPDISDLTSGVYGAKIIITDSAAEGSFKEIEVNLNVIEKIPEDTTSPEVIFDIEPIQTSLSFSVYFEITDKVLDTATPSGLDGFTFRWKEDEEEWQEDDYQEIEEAPLVYSGEREFIGKDEHAYYFQIKAKDIAGNENDWLPESPIFTQISLPKIILINEIQIDSIAGTGGTSDDWVELYNPYDIDVSLTGWSIQKHSADQLHQPCSIDIAFYKKDFSESAKIPSKGFYLIVSTNANNDLKNLADLVMPSGWYLSDNNTVYLIRNQDKIENGEDPDIIDKVGFGIACFPEGSPALNPPEEKSIERKELGVDTDDNGQDFKINDTPTPTNSKNGG